MGKKGLLQRLSEGVVIGDGSFVVTLEKRGYVKAGPYTPEVAVEHPDAVKQLHREFLRAGSDVVQAFTFYSNDDKLNFGDNDIGKTVTCKDINNSACRIATEIAAEGDALVAGGLSQTPSYTAGKGKTFVQAEFREQIDIFLSHKVDFIICEFFQNAEEIEWAIEEAKKSGLPVASTMCIGKPGGSCGTSLGDCAVRMARAGADLVGVNCMFDLDMTIENIQIMKEALDKAGLKPYLMTQPNGFYTTGTGKDGWLECPEYPFAMEARVVGRFDVQKYSRAAYDLGVRYIGGCCGFESYHIRAIAEELSKERGGALPPASEKHAPWGGALKFSTHAATRARASKKYWENLVPNSGRTKPPTYALPHSS